MRMNKKMILLSSVAAVYCAASSAAAQETSEGAVESTVGIAPEEMAAERPSGGLDMIVVTAQKREQSLQEVPISVQVVTGEALRSNNDNDLQDISATLPAVTITDNGVAQFLYIRGIGSGENSGFEQSVGTFIDGVYVGRGRSSRQQQLDLERVEVLRGPQSIFFGNSAIAGALNVATTNPGDEWEGYVNSQYEFEFNGFEVEGAIGGPLTDTLGIRIAGRYADTNGWVTNIVDNSTAPESESFAIRATLAWEPTPDLSVVYKGSYAQNQSYGTPYESIKCPPPVGFPVGPACGLVLTDPAGNTTGLNYTKVSGNQAPPPGLFPFNGPIPNSGRREFPARKLAAQLECGLGYWPRYIVFHHGIS